ncbi:arginine--tRNA ligase, chloroplastic/mitochondrial, partial [Tanacetum coccineum]
TDLDADVIRSRYIRKMLSRMLAYSGVAVGHRDYSPESDDAVKSFFFEDGGEIKSKSSITPLFAVKEEAIQRIPGRSPLDNIFKDLGTLWKAINVQRGELIVFVILVRQREHVEQCITAAKTVKWLPSEWSPTILCIRYRTSSTEREKLEFMWNEFESHPKAAYLVRLDAGYSAEESFECAVKYSYLKTHRLVECTFNIDEMIDAKGDTFIYLLKTQAIIPSHIEKFVRRGMVIDEACLTFNLHPVCEYVKNLYKKFTCYFHEVLQHLNLETYRPEHLNSRFEMFGMNVIVYHLDFEIGHVFADKAISICRNLDLFFGNPSPPCSVTFWLDIEINALLVAITTEKNKCFQLLNCQEPITLSKFWADKLKFERGTLRLGSKGGYIDIDYILFRDALDTSMKLEFEPPKGPNEITYVTRSIFAYYDNGVLDGCDESSKDRYKAVLFHVDVGFELKVDQQELKKSVMVIPADSCLMIEAVIFDVKAGKNVSNGQQELRPGPNNHSEWHIS